MKRKLRKRDKINTSSYFPPFLEGFNTNKPRTEITDINFELVTPTTLDLIKKVSHSDETPNTTINRVLENYLILIELVKVYQMLFYDALKNQTHERLEELKPDFMGKFLGYNACFGDEMDEIIGKEIRPQRYEKMIKTQLKQKKVRLPLISNELVLPALEIISYQDVLDTLVKEGIIPASFLKNLTPKTEYGLLASTVYRGTMKLMEAELRKLIDEERLKIPPQSLTELFSRISRMGEILEKPSIS